MDIKTNSLLPSRTLFGSLAFAFSLFSFSALLYAAPEEDERPAKRQRTFASKAEAQQMSTLPKPCSRPLSESDFPSLTRIPKANIRYEEAQRYLSNGQYVLALSYMQESIDLGGETFSRALGQKLCMGESHMHLGGLVKARSYFREALSVIDYPGPHETRYKTSFKKFVREYVLERIVALTLSLPSCSVVESDDHHGMYKGDSAMGEGELSDTEEVAVVVMDCESSSTEADVPISERLTKRTRLRVKENYRKYGSNNSKRKRKRGNLSSSNVVAPLGIGVTLYHVNSDSEENS